MSHPCPHSNVSDGCIRAAALSHNAPNARQLSCRAQPYVNGTTGSDTLDAGRGESADKPFQTIQACLNYVSSNYNLYIYNCTINITPGDYCKNKRLILPLYTKSTGRIILSGNGDSPEDVIIDGISCADSCIYQIRNLTIKQFNITSSGTSGTISATNGCVLYFYNVIIDVSDFENSSGNMWAFEVSNRGTIYIWSTNSEEPNGIIIKVSQNVNIQGLLRIISGGSFTFTTDITLNGDCSFGTATIFATSLGILMRTTSSDSNPGRAPNFVSTGTITGRRYSVSNNAIVSTASGGREFFPGDTAGAVSSGGQYT